MLSGRKIDLELVNKEVVRYFRLEKNDYRVFTLVVGSLWGSLF